MTAAPLGLCPALSRPRCPPGAEHELRGRHQLRVDEGAVKIEREVGRHAGVGGPAVPGVIDEREERNAQRVARSAGGARLGDVCSLLLDPGRLGCAVQFAVTCCPGVNACQLPWENPANSASFCTRICTQHASGCGRTYSVRVSSAVSAVGVKAAPDSQRAREMQPSSWPRPAKCCGRWRRR